jgi:MFS superfamily sulfate permease-like transporter
MPTDSAITASSAAPDWRRELSSAFGDMGTLAPYLVAYLAVVGMDGALVFLSFGTALLVTGLFYRMPIPVQPMKAIGAAAAAHATQQLVVTPGALALSALLTGVFWLLAAYSGLAQRAGNAVPRDVTKGIILGVGVSLVLEALRLLQTDWLAGVPMVVALLALNTRLRLSPFLVVMLAGILLGAWRQPELVAVLTATPIGFELPAWSLAAVGAPDVWLVALLLAAPQIPLTFGNAMVGLVEETRRVFPQSRISEAQVARSTGWMNLWAGVVGGPPMCHGAGGLAGYLASGARTGLPVAFLGLLFLVLAFFFPGWIAGLLRLLPQSTLGAMLFVVGLYMVIGTAGSNRDKDSRAVLLATAAVTIWNVGAGLVAGLLMHQALKRRWFVL